MRSGNIDIVRYSNGTLVKVAASAHNFMSYDYDGSTGLGTYVPSTITITPTFSGEVVFGSWKYSTDSGVTWNDVVSGEHGLTVNDTTHILSVSSGSDLYVYTPTNKVTAIIFRCVGSDPTYFDSVTISKIIDATYSFKTSYTDFKETSDKISIIASEDELNVFKNTGNTVVTKMNTMDYTADGLLLNVLQAKAVIDGVQFALWDKDTSYPSGSLVIKSGKIYQAVTTTKGNTPPNTVYWKDVTDTYNMEDLSVAQNQIDVTARGTQSIVASTLVDKWIRGHSYAINDIVWNDGKLYQCILGNTADNTNVPPNTTYWKDSMQGTIISQFAKEISLSVYGDKGTTGINLLDGTLNMQSSDIANIIAASTLNLQAGTAINMTSGGTITITGGTVTIGTSSTGALIINSPNFSLTKNGTISCTNGTFTGIISGSYISGGSIYGTSIIGVTLSTTTVTATSDYIGAGTETRRYYLDTNGLHASANSFTGKIEFTHAINGTTQIGMLGGTIGAGFVINTSFSVQGDMIVVGGFKAETVSGYDGYFNSVTINGSSAITETDLISKGYVTSSTVSSMISSALSGYATQSWVNSQLGNYATTSYVNTFTPWKAHVDYVTANDAKVDAISARVSALGG